MKKPFEVDLSVSFKVLVPANKIRKHGKKIFETKLEDLSCDLIDEFEKWLTEFDVAKA